MITPSDKRYKISEVSEMTGLPLHVLRNWEKNVAKLRPKRTRTGRRMYSEHDVELIRTIKYLTKHRGMSLAGASRAISQEGHKGILPQSPVSALDAVKRIQDEIRAMLEEVKPLAQEARKLPK